MGRLETGRPVRQRVISGSSCLTRYAGRRITRRGQPVRSPRRGGYGARRRSLGAEVCAHLAWGTTPEKADAYLRHWRKEGGFHPLVDKAPAVQMLPEDRDEETEFITISWWPSVDAMSAFAGNDPTQIRHLPRDAEFLIELPERVQILEVVNASWFAPPGRSKRGRDGGRLVEIRPTTACHCQGVCASRFRLSNRSSRDDGAARQDHHDVRTPLEVSLAARILPAKESFATR